MKIEPYSTNTVAQETAVKWQLLAGFGVYHAFV
jgi:hypothetical protein